MTQIRQFSQANDGVAAGYPTDNKNIRLADIDNIAEMNDPMYLAAKNTGIDFPDLVEQVSNDYFYYSVVQSIPSEGLAADNFPIFREVGIGYVEDGELVRETPLYRLDGGEIKNKTQMYGQSPTTVSDVGYIVVSVFAPDNVLDALSTGNTVLCSADARRPQPVILDENTVLGRLKDSPQPLSAAELRSILGAEVFDGLFSMVSDLVFHTNNLQIYSKNGRLSSSIVHLDPNYSNSTKPNTPQRGDIVYNADVNRLEFYDGSSWQRIVTE